MKKSDRHNMYGYVLNSVKKVFFVKLGFCKVTQSNHKWLLSILSLFTTFYNA